MSLTSVQAIGLVLTGVFMLSAGRSHYLPDTSGHLYTVVCWCIGKHQASLSLLFCFNIRSLLNDYRIITHGIRFHFYFVLVKRPAGQRM
jgi:hypothetical protein